MTAIPSRTENGRVSETVIVKGEQTVVIDTAVTGNGYSSDSSSSVVEASGEVVSVIKEEDMGIDPVEHNDSPPVNLPKAVEGLHELGPTPFLRKTFEIVDDAVTDPIISWSSTRKSFIIWDSHKFSENLLPKYFKHKNFSSFVRQLNTYGFSKIDSDRWEFANGGFQGGKKHLLKNIKRRSKINCKKDASTTGLETMTEVEFLKKDQSSMKLEILKLKQQQEESHHQIVTVQEKIHRVESKHKHLLSFFAKLAKDQSFVERLMKKRKSELEVTEFVKKLKFLQDQENLLDVEDDLIIRENQTMAATQPNPESNIMTNDESENTRCPIA